MTDRHSRDVWTLLITIVGVVAAMMSFIAPGWLGLSIVLLASVLIVGMLRGYEYLGADRWKQVKRKIYSGVIQDDYLSWQQALLESLYHDLEFVSLFGTKYPAIILRTEKVRAYPFQGLCVLDSTKVPELKQDKQQRRFMRILGSSVRSPKMKGFALSAIEYNAAGRTQKFHAVTTKQEQNLVTCHILEWELFRCFRRMGGRLPASEAEILAHLPYRAKIHDNRDSALAVSEPHNAYPLISVQAIVIFRDTRVLGRPLWRAVLAKRSEKVVVKPGFLQFVPAGGFEVFGGQEDDSEYLVRQGFDVGDAILREYAEELFNAEELQENATGRDPISIRSHPAVHQLLEAVKENTAWIEFIGTIVDLTVLRPEFSFLIVIEDDFFCNSAILGNWESKHVMAPSLQELRAALLDGRLHGSSAGILQLALESKRLHDLGLVAEIDAGAMSLGTAHSLAGAGHIEAA